MKKLLGGFFHKHKESTHAQSPQTASPGGAGGSSAHGARQVTSPPLQYKHGPRSTWDTFFQSALPAKAALQSPPHPLPASTSMHVPAKVFNQNLEMLMREIAAKIKDVITRMIENATFQNEFGQLCGFINLAADKLLERGDPSLVLLKDYFSSPIGVSLCEQTAFPSLVLDFMNKVRIHLIKNELRQLDEMTSTTASCASTMSTNSTPTCTTAAELERPVHFLMSCVQAIASDFSLMDQFRCELPNLINLVAEDYPSSARYLRDMSSLVLASITDRNFNAGLVWYLKDCNIVARTVRMMAQYSDAPRATSETAAAALQACSEKTRSCIANSQSSEKEPIAAAVGDALGLNRCSEFQPNETRQSAVADIIACEASTPTRSDSGSDYYLVGAYDPAPGFKSLVYILQKTCRFSLVLLGEFQSSGGYELLSKWIKKSSELDMSTLIYIYTLLLPLGTGFSGVCGEDENMATVSTCGARNIGAFLSIRDLVLDCMSGLKSESEYELKARLEQLLLQLLTTILQVYTSAYDNFVCLEHQTQALAMILSRLPSIAFFDAQVITLRIVEYVCVSAKADSPLPIEILAVLVSQFIEFSTADVLDVTQALERTRTSSTEFVSRSVGADSRAGLVCECILKILKNSSIPAYQDEFHSFGLLERGVYALFVKVSSSISANTGHPVIQQQYLAAFKSRLGMWSSVVCAILKDNVPLIAEFREMQVHYSLYAIADVIMSEDVTGLKSDVKVPVFSVFVVLANLTKPSVQIAKSQECYSLLQCGVESDLAKLLELLQRARFCRPKQQFIMDTLKQMLHGQLFWEAWQTCQGHEILLSMLSSFQQLDEGSIQDAQFFQLDGVLEMICVTLDPSCSGNERAIEHFATDIRFSTLASCLATSGVMDTDRWSVVMGRVFELITGREAPRNKIRNPNAVETLFCLLPFMPPEHGETCLKRLLSKIISNDDISFSKKKQVSSLVRAGVFRWIGQSSIIAILVNSSHPAQHVLLNFIAEMSKEELSTSHLRDYVRVIAKSMPLHLGNHFHPSKADNGSARSEDIGEEVGLRMLKVALKGSPIPHVAVGTNVRTRMTSGYVHVVNQSDRVWPPSSGYSFSCWLRIPPVDKKRRESSPAAPHESTVPGTVCVALCEGLLALKLDGDEADFSESYCVLVGAELSLFEAAAARNSANPTVVLTVTAVSPKGPYEFFIWCHDKLYVAQSPDRSVDDTEMWVRALQQSESITSRTIPMIKATAEGGNPKDVLFVAGNETSTPESSEDAGLEGFVCLLSVYCLESSGCFTRIYFDQANGCLRIDTGSATAGPNVNPVSKRTSVIFRNVNVNLLRSESIPLDDGEEAKEKASQWHHVAVTHRKSALGNSQVTLFIDGAEVATKKLAYPSTSSAGALQAFLGKDIQICGTFPALPWQLGPTWFVEDVLPPSAIVCIFLLGPSFRGQFGGHAYRSIGDWSEAIATNQLDRATKRRVEVSRAARRAQLIRLSRAARRQWYETLAPGEAQSGNALSDLLMKKEDQDESVVASRLPDAKKRQLKLSSFSSFVNSECSMSVFGLEILDVLSCFKLPDRDVFFSINTSFEALGDSASNGGRLRSAAAQVNFIGTEPSIPLNLAKVLPSLGGVTQFILPLVDNSWRSHELGVSLKLLCRCNRRNPSCLAEFLDASGYALVANILRSRVHLVDDFVLGAVIRLAVSGTISVVSGVTGQKSVDTRPYAWPVVVDYAALSDVVLSQHVRRVLPPKWQIKLMMYMQDLLATENPNAIFNARQLRQAGFVQWVLLFLADICIGDNEVSPMSNQSCFPRFKEDISNDVFVQLVNLLALYTHVENHIEDIVAISDMLLLSLGSQKPFANAKSPFRVAILQYLLHEIEDREVENARTSPRQGRDREGIKMKKDKDEADPLGVTVVDAILLRSGGTVGKKRKDRADAGIGMLASPTATTSSSSVASDLSGNSLLGVLLEIIRRTDSGKFSRLEALLSTRIIFSLAQSYPSFARHVLQIPIMLEKLKRALRGYSADCNFYTPLLAFVSNIPIRETGYHDPVLGVDGTHQFALPTPNGFASNAEMEYLDHVWDVLGAMLHNNCEAAADPAADNATVVVLKQLAFQVEVSEAFFSTVCQSSVTIFRALTLCLLCRSSTVAARDDSADSKQTHVEGIAGLNLLLSGGPPHSSYGHRASACLDVLKIFIMRSLFEREDFAMNVMFLLECIDDELQNFPRLAHTEGQKSWLALVVHVVKHSKALSDYCSFSVLKNLCTLSTALARYLLDESKHQEHGQSSFTDGAEMHAKNSVPANQASTCFGTEVLIFFQSTVRMCAEAHVGQIVGLEDQHFFYGCFVYCAQVALLSELGGLHKCTSPPPRLLDCLVSSRQFFIQQTKVSGVIVCSSGHQHHSSQDNETTTSGTAAARGLNAHISKMKSLTAAAMHREFGIGAESDRSFLLSLAAELLRWLVDDSERVRHAAIALWQFLFQQRMGVIKELLIVEPKVSLLQNMSSNKKEVVDVFHGGFDRLLKISPPRTSSDVSSARISSGELSASHESWLQFHIWLTENYDLLKDLIVTRTEPILEHMIDVLLSCEFVRKVSSSTASNRTSVQADLHLNLDFPRYDNSEKLNRSLKTTTADSLGGEDGDPLDFASGRIATRKAQLKFVNALECSFEDMQDATMRWYDTSVRLQHTRAIWHVGDWNDARCAPSCGGEAPRTLAGSNSRVTTNEPFYLERSVFQQNGQQYRLDFTEGPQRMRLRMIRGYATAMDTSSHLTNPSKEEEPRSRAPMPRDPLQRKLEFHQCVEAFRQFMFKRSHTKTSNDSDILKELADKSNVDRVKLVLRATSNVEDNPDYASTLATQIYSEYLEGENGALLNVTSTVADNIMGAIASARDMTGPAGVTSTLFDLADREAMQATLSVGGRGVHLDGVHTADPVIDSDEEDEEESHTATRIGTALMISDSEDSGSEDEEKTNRTSSNEKTKHVTESARAVSLRLSAKTHSTATDADTDAKLTGETDEKIFDSSSDYVYGAIARFLHRDDYPPLRSYNAAYVAGMSKTMGVFLICQNSIYFVGGYGKQFSDSDSSTAGVGVVTSATNSQSGTTSLSSTISPPKPMVGKKKTKDLIRDTFADIGISLAGSKNSDSTLYTIAPLGIAIAGEISTAVGSSPVDVRSGCSPGQRWCVKYTNVRQFYRIKYQLRPVGIEFFDTSGSTFFVQYESMLEREEVAKVLFQMPIVNSVFWNPLLRSSALSLSVKRIRQNLTKRWLKGGVSNFEYLMHLNTLAGRSFNDITQYPVFPWVLADYTSSFLDLENPAVFRDLSKPMGALGENRAALFRERFAAMNYDAAHSPMDSPAFHYGTHYSCSAYVVNFLIRMEPFSQLARELQGGSFDHADRLFRSIPGSWHSASTENLQDVRELVPEFFFLPEFLYNANDYDLGTTQGGEVVSHVKLPAWAHGDSREFIRLHRRALESKYVSENLHHWIDLVFGYKQTGAAALDAQNVFMHFTYEGAVDLDAIDDPVMRNAMLSQIENFGQTPSKLFTTPHPPRKVPSLVNISSPPTSLTTAAATTQGTPPGIGQAYDGNTIGSIDGFIKWHTPLAPTLISVGNDYVLLKKHSIANILEAPVGDVRIVGDKFQCRGVGCTFMPPRFTKYLEWGSNVEGTMKLRVHSSSARHREANKVVGVIDGAHHSRVNCAAFSDDGVVLVTGGQDAVVNVIECSKVHGQRQFRQLAKLVGHEDGVSSVAINRPYNLVASASRDGCVILWDLRTRTFLRELAGHNGAILQIGINSMSGNIVACSSSELRLWSINGDLLAATTTQAVGLSEMTCGLATNCETWQDGIFAVSGHSNGTVTLWGLRFPSEIVAERQKQADGTSTTATRYGSASSYSSATLKTAVRVGVHRVTTAGSSGEGSLVVKAIPTCQFVIKKLLMDHRTAITTLHVGVDQRQLVSSDEDGVCIRWVDDSISAYTN